LEWSPSEEAYSQSPVKETAPDPFNGNRKFIVVVTQAIRTYPEVLNTLYGLTSCAFKINCGTTLQGTLTSSMCLLSLKFSN